MPVSAYIQSALFLMLTAVALFASAGTVEISVSGFISRFSRPSLWLRSCCSIPVCCASGCAQAANGRRWRCAIFALVLVLHWIVAGLDRGRFHWSDGVPAWLRASALSPSRPATGWRFGLCGSIDSSRRWCASSPTAANTWSPRGPYAVIRHPGYLAGIVIIVASGIALGSWLAAALLIVLSLPFLLYRAITEDRVLQAELPGYRDYAARVRWRLLPGIW